MKVNKNGPNQLLEAEEHNLENRMLKKIIKH